GGGGGWRAGLGGPWGRQRRARADKLSVAPSGGGSATMRPGRSTMRWKGATRTGSSATSGRSSASASGRAPSSGPWLNSGDRAGDSPGGARKKPLPTPMARPRRRAAAETRELPARLAESGSDPLLGGVQWFKRLALVAPGDAPEEIA